VDKVSIELDDVVVVAVPHEDDFLCDLGKVLLHRYSLNCHNLSSSLVNGLVHNPKGPSIQLS